MIEAINQIYKHRKDFILIGLTGKIGSGCTTTADFLSKKKRIFLSFRWLTQNRMI